MNLAVIDIGTLKVKFLIAQASADSSISELYSSSTLTQFGSNIDSNNGNVHEEFLVRTIAELKRCNDLLREYNVTRYRVVSTHAMRKARNREEILQRIREEVGFEVENITAEEEARLFYHAVVRDFRNKNQKYAIADIGGGSVQILIGTPEAMLHMHTMPTGAAVLHDTFTSDPNVEESLTTEDDIERMRNHILNHLIELQADEDIPLIYGSSNIIDLMQTIGITLDDHTDSHTHPFKTYAQSLDEFVQRMLPLTYKEREALFNFQKGYMWGIDKAFTNVLTIADHFHSPYIIPSNANVARGLMYWMLES